VYLHFVPPPSTLPSDALLHVEDREDCRERVGSVGGDGNVYQHHKL
jgi:hypothetical protein